LTTGKREIELAIMEGLTEKLERIGLDIRIVGVERQFADPPNPVKDAFQDVINAREEKRALIHEAENYRNQELPKANGEADRMIQEARAFKFDRTSSAVGESERFLKIHGEYRRAPEVTRNRLFIEMIEHVLPRTKVMVLATDREGRPLRIKLFQGSVPTSPSLPE
jgi:membrane protease subunit HflK